MYALNRAQIIGYLVEDPEIRQTPSGQSVGNLTVVTKYHFKDNTGVLQEGNAYHHISVWRGLADICGQYLRKGSNVYFAGRLQTDNWEDESGEKKYRTKITADEMIMLDPKKDQSDMDIPTGSSLAGSLNRAEVIGNLTRDAELRQTPGGSNVTSFSVATDFIWRDKNGEEQKKTEFHNIVAWDNLAEEVNKYLKKGRKVYVTGRIQTRSWETPDGKKKYATEIVAEKVLVLGIKAGNLGSTTISKDETVPATVAAADSEITPDMIPEINYNSDVKPEDLPF